MWERRKQEIDDEVRRHEERMAQERAYREVLPHAARVSARTGIFGGAAAYMAQDNDTAAAVVADVVDHITRLAVMRGMTAEVARRFHLPETAVDDDCVRSWQNSGRTPDGDPAEIAAACNTFAEAHDDAVDAVFAAGLGTTDTSSAVTAVNSARSAFSVAIPMLFNHIEWPPRTIENADK